MLKLIPLGGLGEIGLNMMAIEYDQQILVIDAGLMFPEEYMPGVDVVIPDFHYLKENQSKIISLILTHGHEDHIGAVPFLLKEMDLPVVGTSFTIELLKAKLREHDISDAALEKVAARDIRNFGPFRVEFIRVNHSIVDGVGLAIDTPEGLLIHSGDFKIDHTPVDGYCTDLARFAHYGEQGVLALLSDSTNVENDGFTLSEREVKRALEELFLQCEGRIVVAVFASNITRIQQVIKLAEKFNRKIVFSGKSMKTNVRIALDEGILCIPDEMEISEKRIAKFPDNEVAVITTGSQGEPMSALTRMAQDRHKNIKIRKGDTVILSSRFIPGNEKAITSIINSLYRRGADVVYEKVSDIHSSGHAYKEELKLIINLVNPQYFIPVHGEYRHLIKHIRLAEETGVPNESVLLVENGDTVCFENRGVSRGEPVQTGRILVDGKGLGDVGDLVLRDRRKLSADGVVIVLLAVDEHSGELVWGPELVSKGFLFEGQSDSILEEAKDIILEVVAEIESPAHIGWTEVAPDIKRRLKRFFFKVIERNPLILPIIIPL